jgi:hypothetical protein
MSTDQLMDKLIKAVSFKFKEDKTAPGVVVSALKKGYYCSVVRYGGAFAKDKKVVCHARGDDLPTTLKSLANTFVTLSAQPKDPVQELGDLVSAKG